MRSAAPVSIEDGFDYWVERIKRRIRDRYDAVVVITAPEGHGKSTVALRLASAFDPSWSPAQLCYTAGDVFHAYRAAVKGRGDPIVFDEGVRGLLAGETFNPEQIALVKALTLVRSKGAILTICVPSIHMVAKQIRGRRATLWIHIESRGRALVHERDDRLKYLPTAALGLTISPTAPLLTWDAYADDDPFWVAYERRKDESAAQFLSEGEKMLGPRHPSETSKEANARRQREWRERRRIKRYNSKGSETPSEETAK
jgi:hypothetical protein